MRKDDSIRLRHMLEAATDVDRVWDTISDDLPPLITVLERILNSKT